MKTSVVMATYNGEEFLNQQLNSILSQTVLPDEIVVVDDGSSDKTKEILVQYTKEHDNLNFNLIFRDENIGYIKNFVDGINQAKNELIFLCDQDDLWTVNKIEKIKNYFKDNPDMITLHTSTNIIDRDNITMQTSIQGYSSSLEKVNVQKFITKINYSGMSMAFLKSKVVNTLNELATKTTLPTHDWTLGYIACVKDGFYISNEVLTDRRYTGQNVALDMNNVMTIKKRMDGVLLYKKYFEFLKEVSDKTSVSVDVDVDKYLTYFDKRINYLEHKNFFGYLKNIRYLSQYPSKKAYIADILVMIKDNKGIN